MSNGEVKCLIIYVLHALVMYSLLKFNQKLIVFIRQIKNISVFMKAM